MQKFISEKLLCFMAALLLMLFGATGYATNTARLTWAQDLPTAIKQAGADHKWILADVYTDWCTWCKRLDTDTYTDPAVVKYLNKSFVCVKLNAEDGGSGKSFAQQYSIHGYPCMVLLDSSGTFKGMIRGYQKPSDFLYAMKQNTLNQPGFKP